MLYVVFLSENRFSSDLGRLMGVFTSMPAARAAVIEFEHEYMNELDFEISDGPYNRKMYYAETLKSSAAVYTIKAMRPDQFDE